MRKIRGAALCITAALFTGCQSDLDTRYLDASVGGRLELPPDLTEYEAESSFALPEVFAGDDASVRNRIPVLAQVESLRLEGSQDFYWLSVEEPVDNLYQLVKNFWASEGYRLTKDEPVIGIMETEWILKEVGSSEEKGGWLANLFGGDDLSAVQDQFKTRIDRDDSVKSRIYIAHRGAEYKYVLDSDDRGAPLNNAATEEDSQWRFRPPDPELETEMLSRLMIYLGMQKTQVDQQLDSVKLFRPRAFMQQDAKQDSPFLILKDPYHIAWNRVYHNLERLNFEIESAVFKSGFAAEGVFLVKVEYADLQQKTGLFSLGSKAKSKTRNVVLILSEQTHELTRVDIETADGEDDSSPEGAEFMKLLYRQIK
jgi:outer membrane protein assembly factor BamC